MLVCSSEGRLATAYECYNFQCVAFGEHGICKMRFGQNLVIQLYSNATSRILVRFQIFSNRHWMPIDQVIASFAEVIPFIHTKLDVVLYSALPGNIFKGLIVSVITMLVYKRVSPAMKGMR